MTLIRERLDRARREEGFTFVELAVAVAILGTSLVLLTALIANNLGGVLHGKQRAAANSLAQQVLEKARSTPYGRLGLSDGDTTIDDDPDIFTDSSGTNWFGPDCSSGVPPAAGANCEQLIELSTQGPPSPFNLHREGGIQQGPSTLERWIYVTAADQNKDGAPDDGDADGVVDLKRVTVRVEWGNPGLRGADNRVRLETLIDPSRTEPAPGLTGSAFVRNGAVNLVTEIDGTTDGVRQFLPFVDMDSSSRGGDRRVSCSARSGVIEPSGDESFGPTAISTVADGDPDPVVEERNTSGALPSDVTDQLDTSSSDSSFPGDMRCYSSVREPDPETTAAGDDLPYGRGRASNASGATLTYETDSITTPALDHPDTGDPVIDGRTIVPMRFQTDTNTGTEDAEAILNVQEGDTTELVDNTLLATATQYQGDLQFIRLSADAALLHPLTGLATRSFSFSPSNGLVNVRSYNVTAFAKGTREADSADVSCSSATADQGCGEVSGSTVSVRIYNPAIVPVLTDDDDGDGQVDEDGPDDDGDGLINEDPEDGLDNDLDGQIDEDPLLTGIDNDGDGEVDEDPPGAFTVDLVRPLDTECTSQDGDYCVITRGVDRNLDTISIDRTLGTDLPCPSGIDDDGDGEVDEDPHDGIDNDGDGSVDEDPPEGIDDDGDGQVDEDPEDGVDNDLDGQVDEDPPEGTDDDGDGQVDEDPEDGVDNDGDGQVDEDPVFACPDLPKLHYSVSVSGSASEPGPVVGPNGITWRAQASPLIGSARFCVTTGANCDQGTRYVDVRDDFDMGTIVAEVFGGS